MSKYVCRPKQNKCVKAYTLKITDKADLVGINALFVHYGLCVDYFYHQLDGIQSMSKIQSWRNIRNDIRKKEKIIRRNRQDNIQDNQMLLTEQFDIQGRHWVQALQQACMNLNSMWSNLGNKLKKQVQNNESFTDAERAYLNYVLSARGIWQSILLYGEQTYYLKHLQHKKLKYLNLRNNLNNDQLHRLHNYIRRVTRKNKPYPHINNFSCILLE